MDNQQSATRGKRKYTMTPRRLAAGRANAAKARAARLARLAREPRPPTAKQLAEARKFPVAPDP